LESFAVVMTCLIVAGYLGNRQAIFADIGLFGVSIFQGNRAAHAGQRSD